MFYGDTMFRDHTSQTSQSRSTLFVGLDFKTIIGIFLAAQMVYRLLKGKHRLWAYCRQKEIAVLGLQRLPWVAVVMGFGMDERDQ